MTGAREPPALAPAAASNDEQIFPARRIQWKPGFRIVPTRFPTVYLFDRVADADDFELLYALEALTNDRVRDETGQLELVAPEDRIYGVGSGPIMAAFTHINPSGSRFSDGRYGMFYAARERETAIAETRYHHGRFLAATAERPMHLPMRLYQVNIDARLHDLRQPLTRASGQADSAGDLQEGRRLDAAIHAPDDYATSRTIGARLQAAGSAGVIYRSVRHPQGQCVGLFKPRGASQCLHAAHLLYAWDGTQISGVFTAAG